METEYWQSWCVFSWCPSALRRNRDIVNAIKESRRFKWWRYGFWITWLHVHVSCFLLIIMVILTFRICVRAKNSLLKSYNNKNLGYSEHIVFFKVRKIKKRLPQISHKFKAFPNDWNAWPTIEWFMSINHG